MATPRVRLEGQPEQPDPADSASQDPATQDPQAADTEATSETAVTQEEVAPAQEDSTDVKVPRFGEFDGVNEVVCMVPKPIRLVLDGSGSYTLINAGLQNLPEAVAKHWWCRVNGVVIADQLQDQPSQAQQ